MKNVLIIAEAGVNHNGDLDTALRMVTVAKKCGADIIKFQTFTPAHLVSRFAPKAEYQKQRTRRKESQLQMLNKLALDQNAFKKIIKRCQKEEITFLSSPFDIDSIAFLSKLDVDMIKIPSGEITNLPYLEMIGKMKKKLLLSTGMSTLREVEDSIAVLVRSGTPRNRITLLHCTTEYPAPFIDVNLRAMGTMHSKFKVSVGYSDHTPGIEIAIAAAALGARVIEKHFTLDKNMSGPDHKASLEPPELEALVTAIRNVEKAMGNGNKKPAPSEIKNRNIARKSIVALKKINKGALFSIANITIKRPGTGISPMKWYHILGKQAPRSFKPDELIEL